MKKLLGVLTVLFCLSASTFAVDFAVGGKGFFGKCISPDNTSYNGFVSGGGAFFNLDLLMGLGIQTEVNVMTNRVTFASNSVSFTEYETIDVPVYVWFNLPIKPVTIGGGLGVNFSGHSGGTASQQVIVGVAAGANIIAYVAPHFGIVFGANYVWDAFPQMEKSVSGDTSTYTFIENDKKRHQICGSVGLEFIF